MKELNDIINQYELKLSSLKQDLQKISAIEIYIDVNKDILEQLNLEIISNLEKLLDVLEIDSTKKSQIQESINYYKKNMQVGIDLSLLLKKDEKCLNLIASVIYFCNEISKYKKSRISDLSREINEINDIIQELKTIFQSNSQIDISLVEKIIEKSNFSLETCLEIYKSILLNNLSIHKKNTTVDEIEARYEEIGVAIGLDDDDIHLGAKIERLNEEVLDFIKKISERTDLDFSEISELKLKIDKLISNYNEYLEMKNDADFSDSKADFDEDFEKYQKEYQQLKKQFAKISSDILRDKTESTNDSFENFIKKRKVEKKYNVILTKKAYKEFFNFFKPGSKDISTPFINGMIRALKALETKSSRELQSDILSSKLSGSNEGAFEYKVHTPPNGGAYRVIFFYFKNAIIIPSILFKNEPRDAHVVVRDVDDFISQERRDKSERTKHEFSEIMYDVLRNDFDDYEERILKVYEKLYEVKEKRLGRDGDMCDTPKRKNR